MPRKYQRFLQISIKTLSIPELCPANGNTSTYVPFTRNEGHRVHKTTGPYHTSIASKVLKHIPSRMRDMSKKVFKRKLISVLFEILKDKDDYLDATMITREIKSRNPKPYLLSQVALNRYVFLDFEFITHISSFFFFFFAFYLLCNTWFVIELIWHPSTSVFLLTASQKIVLVILW